MTITTLINYDLPALKQRIYLARDSMGITRTYYPPLKQRQLGNYIQSWQLNNRRNFELRTIYGDSAVIIKTREEEYHTIYEYFQEPFSRPSTYISRQEFLDSKYPDSYIEIVDEKWFFRTLTVPSAVEPTISYIYSENTSGVNADKWEAEEIEYNSVIDRMVVPQGISDIMSSLPSGGERKEWKTLIDRLVNTLDNTNANANNIVEMSGIAAMQIQSIHATFREMVNKLPDDEFKGSLASLVAKMDATIEQVNKVSSTAEEIFKPHEEKQKLTGFDIFDKSIAAIGNGSIFLFFASLLMHIRHNTFATFFPCISVAILLYLQGKHTAWITAQIGTLLVLFPKTSFVSKQAPKKATEQTVWLRHEHTFSEDYPEEDIPLYPDQAVPQMMSENELSGAFSVFTTLFLGFFAKGEKISDKMMHFFSNFKRVEGGVLEFGSLLKKMLEWLATKVRNIYIGSEELPSVRFFKTHNADYEKYTLEVRKFCKGFNDKSIAPTHSNILILESLIVVGETLARKFPRDPLSRDLARLLDSDINSLKMVRTHFERANITTTGFRQEPASLVFFGGPGTGKSKAINESAFAAVARSLPEDQMADFLKNPASRIYNRAAENIYWDGYLPQNMVCTFDDFGQAIDVAGQPDNEYMNFVRAVNGFEYNLHMAAVETKGTTTFQSKYVVISTNLTKIEPQSIFHPGAVLRRMDLKYVVVPREQYLTDETKDKGYACQKLDPAKLPRIKVQKPDGTWVETTDFQTDHQWFIPCDENMQTGIGPKETFEEVMEKWFAIYDRKEAHYLQNLHSFHKCFDIYRDRYAQTMKPEMDDIVMEDIFEGPEFTDISGSTEPGIENVSLDAFDGDSDDDVWGHHTQPMVVPQSIEIQSDTSSHYDYHSTSEFIFRELHGLDVCMADEVFRSWFSSNRKEYWRYLPKNLGDITSSHLSIWTGKPEQEIYSSLNEFVFVWKNQQIPVKQRIKRWGAQFDLWLEKKFPFLGYLGNGKYAAIFVALPLAVTLITKMLMGVYDYFFPGTQYAQAQSMNHNDRMKVNKTFAKHYKNGTMKQHAKSMLQTVTPQMGSDVNGCNLMKSIAAKYIWKVCVWKETGEWSYKGLALHLGNEDVLCPNHYLGSFFHNMLYDPQEANTKIRFSRLSKRNNLIEHVCTKADLIAGQSMGDLAKKKDLVICRVQGFPQAASILPFIVSNDKLSRDRNSMSAGLFGYRQSTYFNARWRDTPVTVTQQLWDVEWVIREYYQYMAHTEEGDCGALFVKMDSREPQQKIYGIHVAGTGEGGCGFASAITREEIQAELDTFDFEQTVVPQGIETSLGNIEVIGSLARNEIPSSCLKNNIIKSPIYNCTIPARTAPAILKPVVRNGETLNPMLNAYRKYDISHKQFTDEQKRILEEVTTQIFDYQLNVSRIMKEPRVYTVREALYGTDESEGLLGITANTSAGWPMNLPGYKNDKKLLFPPDFSDPKFVLNFELFEKEIQDLVVAYKRGERPEWYYVDVLKVERRELEKVRLAKTRMFSAGPFRLLVLDRMYFGHFDVVYKQNRILNWSAVGVNPYSFEWEHIARHLCKFDPTGQAQVGAGDYSSFDCTHNPFVHDLIVDHINRYYYSNADDVDHQVRTLLFKEISNSRHIVGDKKLQWKGSMPSGNALTIDINNIYNSIAFGYCYCRILQDYPEIQLSMEDFCENVVLILTGDDNVFSVHPDMRDFMNELSLPHYMVELGLIYTTELKSTAVSKFRRLEEVSFLKRTWVKDPHACRYIAPQDLFTILEICYWTKNSSDWLQISVDNVVNTLNELSLHSKEVWEKYAPKIISAAQREYPGIEFSSPITKPWYKRREMTLKLLTFF